MKSFAVILVIVGFTVLVNSGCLVTHETMRSSIVMKLENEAHICIGAEDGIKVGDILTVYRTKQVPLPKEPVVPDRSGQYSPRTKYEMVKVGKARVIALLGEHYAAIEPLDIELEMSDIIEKNRDE